MAIYNAAWAIPLLPLIGALGSLGVERPAPRGATVRRILRPLLRRCGRRAGRPADARHRGAFESLLTFFAMTPPEGATFATQFQAQVGVQVDALSTSFAAAIALATLVIQGYAVNAMRGEPGYRRFFCGSSVLAFCTTGFVLSPNLFNSLIMWVGASASLYVLLTLSWQRAEPARKAHARDGHPHGGRHRAHPRRRLRMDQVRCLLVAARAAVRTDDRGSVLVRRHLAGSDRDTPQERCRRRAARDPGAWASCSLSPPWSAACSFPSHSGSPTPRRPPFPVLALACRHGRPARDLSRRAHLSRGRARSPSAARARTGGRRQRRTHRRDRDRTAQHHANCRVRGGVRAGSRHGRAGHGRVRRRSVHRASPRCSRRRCCMLAVGNLVRVYRTDDIAEMGGAWAKLRTTSIALGVWALLAGGIGFSAYYALSSALSGIDPAGGVFSVSERVVVIIVTIIAAVLGALLAGRLLLSGPRERSPAGVGFSTSASPRSRTRCAARSGSRSLPRWWLCSSGCRVSSRSHFGGAGMPGSPSCDSSSTACTVSRSALDGVASSIALLALACGFGAAYSGSARLASASADGKRRVARAYCSGGLLRRATHGAGGAADAGDRRPCLRASMSR